MVYTYCTMSRDPVSFTLENPKQFGRAIARLVKRYKTGSLRPAAKVVGLSPRGLALILAGKRARIRRKSLDGIERLYAAVLRSGTRDLSRFRSLRGAFRIIVAEDAHLVLARNLMLPGQRPRKNYRATPAEVKASNQALDRATRAWRCAEIGNTFAD